MGICASLLLSFVFVLVAHTRTRYSELHVPASHSDLPAWPNDAPWFSLQGWQVCVRSQRSIDGSAAALGNGCVNCTAVFSVD